MNYLKIIFLKSCFRLSLLFILVFKFAVVNAQDIEIKINGNEFTDDEVVFSIIKEMPNEISDEYLNYLLKTIDNSNLFQSVTVKIDNNSYLIDVTEYANIRQINFSKNKRIKDEDLLQISNEIKLTNSNPLFIDKFVNETKKIYQSFGYNNVEINHIIDLDQNSNTIDISFEIIEGNITKINRIYFEGNNIDESLLRSKIKSKTKSLKNIFANNNFKLFTVKNDIRNLINYYKDQGYRDIDIDYQIEYLKSDKVNIYLKFIEGELYQFSNINFVDKNNIINESLQNSINYQINIFLDKNNVFSRIKTNNLKKDIATNLKTNGINFFEIKVLEKIDNNKVNLLFEINSIEPRYTNQINIFGNYRTFDYVIRRELGISEGDSIASSQIEEIEKNIRSLNLFKSVKIEENQQIDNTVNLDITVEEMQTGTFSAGVAVGTIDGFSVVAGLDEKNFGGTGRSVKTILNTSNNRKQFTLETKDRILYEDNVDLSFSSSYIEQDFSKSSSYKLNSFQVGTGIAFDISNKIRHKISLEYSLKDYIITNRSNAASQIKNSEGASVSILLNNVISYNNINSNYNPTDGNSLIFANSIETPTSSTNGYIRNILTLRQYKKIDKNILSNQTRIGNIYSLSNNDILTDNKFSLGGRWLRGFDVYGAGPRNSSTSYVGGNNLIVTKFDLQRELLNNSNYPIYLNLFNDYGLVWDNKTAPTNNDSDLRASYGIGLKYYSPIGPIGFSWGFPLIDKDYDIKRMFLFSVGNLN